MSIETAEPDTVLALPRRLVEVQPDGTGGVLLTLRPDVTFGEIVAALMLWPPDLAWTLPPLAGPDGSLDLAFAEPLDG